MANKITLSISYTRKHDGKEIEKDSISPSICVHQSVGMSKHKFIHHVKYVTMYGSGHPVDTQLVFNLLFTVRARWHVVFI